MKDEIKEILELFKEYASGGMSGLYPPEETIKNLLDYITNLQEENKRLKDLCDKYEEEHNTAFKLWTMKMEEIPTYEEKKELQNRIKELEQINEEHRELNGELREENEKLREENKHIFANVNDDQLLRSNAMNYAELKYAKQELERYKNIVDELEKWLIAQRNFIETIDIMPNLKEVKLEHKIMINDYTNTLDKLKELKEEDKE